jgi:hypothetical protein
VSILERSKSEEPTRVHSSMALIRATSSSSIVIAKHHLVDQK